MLKLIEAGKNDPKKEWEFVSTFKSENGFENNYYGCSLEEYIDNVLPCFKQNAVGENLSPGHVPQTTFFLMDDDVLVGFFKVRHFCNDVTRANGTGHIGYAIKEEYRGKGYAKRGLALAIDELLKMPDYDPKDDIIMGFRKNNIASRKVQEGNGAKIIGETEEDYITKIEIK